MLFARLDARLVRTWKANFSVPYVQIMCVQAPKEHFLTDLTCMLRRSNLATFPDVHMGRLNMSLHDRRQGSVRRLETRTSR
jgi:hypothetical protein